MFKGVNLKSFSRTKKKRDKQRKKKPVPPTPRNSREDERADIPQAPDAALPMTKHETLSRPGSSRRPESVSVNKDTITAESKMKKPLYLLEAEQKGPRSSQASLQRRPTRSQSSELQETERTVNAPASSGAIKFSEPQPVTATSSRFKKPRPKITSRIYSFLNHGGIYPQETLKITKSNEMNPYTQEKIHFISCFAEIASLSRADSAIQDLAALMEPNKPLEDYRDVMKNVEFLRVIDSTANDDGSTNGVRVYIFGTTSQAARKQLIFAFHAPPKSPMTLGLGSSMVKYRRGEEVDKGKNAKNRVKKKSQRSEAAKEKEAKSRKQEVRLVDSYFWSLYKKIYPNITAELMFHLEKKEYREIIVTGYEDAAAIAILFMMDVLQSKDMNLSAYLTIFSCPKIGNAAFVEYYNELVAKYRKRSFMGYNDYSIIIPSDNFPMTAKSIGTMRYHPDKGYRHTLNNRTFCLFQDKLYYIPKYDVENHELDIDTEVLKRFDGDDKMPASEGSSLPPHMKKVTLKSKSKPKDGNDPITVELTKAVRRNPVLLEKNVKHFLKGKAKLVSKS